MSQSKIEEAYRKAHPTSEKLAEKARERIAGGITHDIRELKPFPLYIQRASGTQKWAVDGQQLLDYWMGHGALFLGHQHPEVAKAVVKQYREGGTHYGACHPLELRWAELVCQLVPSAERVRFTGTGTEATLLALRLARAYTGREKILKFEGHFHGWHDYATVGVKPPYARPSSAGIPKGVLDQILLCPPNDPGRVEEILTSRDDVAAVILEPGGGSSGMIPTDPAFLRGLREVTRRTGVVLIFDEVITGFRYAPGGAQESFGVTPDLTTLAKIIAGGLPGGAVVGRADIMDLLAFRDDPQWNRSDRVSQAGTYNANPLSAAAGIATLELLADGQAHKRANQSGDQFRTVMNDVLKRRGLPGCVYGESSIYHISLEPLGVSSDLDEVRRLPAERLQTVRNPATYHKLRCAMILNGVDLHAFHGWISAVHTEAEIEQTAEAFDRSLRMLEEEGALA